MKSLRILISFLLFVLIVSGQTIQARPFSVFQTFQDDEKKSLPPVHYVRSRDFDTKHIFLDLKFDWDKELINGVEEFTFSPLTNNFRKLTLDAGMMTFNSVKLKAGEELEFSYDEPNSKLTINFEQPYKITDVVTVVINYQAKGANSGNSLGFGGSNGLKFVKPANPTPSNPRQIWTQGESEYNKYWFPSYDYPNDFRTTEIKATIEKPMQVISNGKLLETKDNGNSTRTFHWKMDTPYTNYLTSLVIGEFTEVRGNYQDIPVSTYVYPAWKKEGEVTAKRLPTMVKFFSEKLNFKYPYAKYAQSIGNTFNGGMENITATTQTDDMIIDARTELDVDWDGLQAHELAHQWFGDYVTCRDWSEIWLNESFATYMESLWQLESKGKDYFLFNDLKNNQDAYLNTWKNGVRRPIVTKFYANPDAVFDTYAYPRGGAVLHILRKQLGDENFFRALNHYLKSNANEPVQTEDLRIAIEESTGQSMDAFFDQWLYRMGHPVFDVTQEFNDESGELTLNVKQVQEMDLTSDYPQVKYFQMPVDIEIVTEKGTKIETVFIKPQAENVFTFKDLDSKPLLVDFDNEGTLIKEIKFPKTFDELIYQAKNDKDILGRNWAMQELNRIFTETGINDTDSEKVLELFRNSAVNDPSWQLRREALSILGQVFEADPNATLDAETIAVLRQAATDKHSQVRGIAINLLGMTKDKKHADIYKKAVNDQSYYVIDEAAIALARTKDSQAYAILTKLVNTKSWQDRIMLAGLNGLAFLEDARALNLGLKYGKDKSQTGEVRSAALTIVASVGKGNAEAFPLIFDEFKKSIETNNFQGMFSGIDSIVKLADPRGKEAFEILRNKFKGNPQALQFINIKEAEFNKAIEK